MTVLTFTLTDNGAPYDPMGTNSTGQPNGGTVGVLALTPVSGGQAQTFGPPVRQTTVPVTYAYTVPDTFIGQYTATITWSRTSADTPAPVSIGRTLTLPAPQQASGSYCTVDDLRVRLTQQGLESDAATAAHMTDDDLARAIARAQAEVDSYLAGSYPVPFTSPPPIVHELTLDLATYGATLTQYRSLSMDVDHPSYLRANDARKLLLRYSQGQATLILPPNPTTGTQPQTSGSSVSLNADWRDGDVFGAQDVYGLLNSPWGYPYDIYSGYYGNY